MEVRIYRNPHLYRSIEVRMPSYDGNTPRIEREVAACGVPTRLGAMSSSISGSVAMAWGRYFIV